jgi:hypothetical protein
MSIKCRSGLSNYCTIPNEVCNLENTKLFWKSEVKKQLANDGDAFDIGVR